MSLFSHGPRAATEDYDISSLPKTRREVFRDVCGLHWGRLLLLGLLLLLFALPVFLCGLYQDITMLLLAEQVEKGAVGTESAVLLARRLKLFCALIRIFLLILFSIGLAGAMQIVKRYAWLENVSPTHDFAKGIRQNVRQYALLLSAGGVLALLCTYAYHMMPLAGSEVFYRVAAYIPTALCLLFLLPVGALMIPCIAIYDNKLSQHTQYGMLLFLKYGWRILLRLAICASPLALLMIPKLIFRVIGGVTAGLLLPFSLLAWFLSASDWLDQEVNRDYYPQLVEKGLLGLKGENTN